MVMTKEENAMFRSFRNILSLGISAVFVGAILGLINIYFFSLSLIGIIYIIILSKRHDKATKQFYELHPELSK